MLNSQEFALRLQKVIEYYGESGASFAQKIGVQRSSISHILSGRNKPNLDFITKILTSYTEVDMYWLINVKGNFPKLEDNNVAFVEPINETLKRPLQEDSNEIVRIVIFYKDGSFKNYMEYSYSM